MTPEAYAAIGALWLALSGLAGGVIAYLRAQVATVTVKCDDAAKASKTECSQRVAKLEAKLDESSSIILRQSEAQQAQIAAQQQMISALQTALPKVEAKP